MKLFYTSLFLTISYFSSGQFYLSSGYSLSLPKQEMKKNIRAVHSLALSGLYRLPGNMERIQFGADFAWGMYASTRKEQTFTFSNGDITRTNVFYSSMVVQGGLQTRIDLLRNKVLTPYLNGKTGY